MMMVGKRKIYTNTFNDRLYKACDSCGIPRRSMHKIRKTYGTLLLDTNIEDSLVMEQMGHSDIATTRRYYYFSIKTKRINFHKSHRQCVSEPLKFTWSLLRQKSKLFPHNKKSSKHICALSFRVGLLFNSQYLVAESNR